MPPDRNNSAPPAAMTWSKAFPVIIVAALFDALRLICEMFWFFGPALAALICTIMAADKLSSWTFGLFGTKTAAVACSAFSATVGTLGIEVSAPFGVFMADAVGLLGFLTLGLWIIMTNARLFRVSTMSGVWFIGGFALAEIPFIGSLPMFSMVLWKLYRNQIRVEKAALAQWEESHALEIAQQRAQQEAQWAYLEEQQAANTTTYEEAQEENEEKSEQQEAANDALYDAVPDEERKAA